jgi:hypothetical protein
MFSTKDFHLIFKMYFYSSSFNFKSSKRSISHVNSCAGVMNKNGDKKTHFSFTSEQFKLHLQWNYYIMMCSNKRLPNWLNYQIPIQLRLCVIKD